ncbi:MAG: peptidyl-prolyl cis-trans isomerase cyclophilin type [Pedosphaera sp.]|nr:peptidyl-prolyl cis-trans isomerase cyclophilin type [Pedosphaera sp.]
MKKLRCLVVLLLGALLAGNSRGGTLVVFNMYLGVGTPMGQLEVELYDQDKPVTVKNFLHLIQAGAYQNGFFHRLVPGFVLQGGGYYAANPFATNIMVPPFSNIGVQGNFGNITNEFKVGAFRSNTNGTIAMAKTSDPNSANSQFFFNLVNNAASLDDTNNSGGFTVFGHVIRDSNGILNFFNTLSYGRGLVDLSKNYGANGNIFTQLPNALISTNPPPYDDLIYYTISILNAQVKLQTNGTRQISWNSITGLTNRVEYATNLPPAWQVLSNVVGNGSATNAIDSTTNKARFYRVHVLY